MARPAHTFAKLAVPLEPRTAYSISRHHMYLAKMRGVYNIKLTLDEALELLIPQHSSIHLHLSQQGGEEEPSLSFLCSARAVDGEVQDDVVDALGCDRGRDGASHSSLREIVGVGTFLLF